METTNAPFEATTFGAATIESIMGAAMRVLCEGQGRQSEPRKIRHLGDACKFSRRRSLRERALGAMAKDAGANEGGDARPTQQFFVGIHAPASSLHYPPALNRKSTQPLTEFIEALRDIVAMWIWTAKILIPPRP